MLPMVKCILVESFGRFGLPRVPNLPSNNPDVVATRRHLTHMVAVGHSGRGVVNPCGWCRQQLLDLSPDIHVLVRDGDEVKESSPGRPFISGQRELKRTERRDRGIPQATTTDLPATTRERKHFGSSSAIL